MFLKGRSCRSGKSDSVVKHEASDFHNLASRRQSAVGESLAEKAQQTLNAAAYEKMRVLFNIVHSLAKNNRPMSDFIFQRKLHEVNAQMSLGVTYNSVTEATYFLGYIALEAFQKLAETVNDSKFVSLTGDDSTDVSATEQSLWFVRTVKQGHIQVHLLGSTALEKADAEGIVNGLRNVVKQNLDCSLDKLMQKVASTTTDGASVMLFHITFHLWQCVISLVYIDRLVQKRHISSALAMEICLSCTNPSICHMIITAWNGLLFLCRCHCPLEPGMQEEAILQWRGEWC